MAPEPALYSVPAALQALVQPPDHSTGYFAPAALGRNDIAPLELEAVRAGNRLKALVVAADQIEAGSGVQLDKIVDALANQINTIILSADHMVTDAQCRQLIESIDEQAAKHVGYLNLVFHSNETFSANYFDDPARQNRCRRILVKNTPTRDAVLCGSIMNLLDAHFGEVDIRRRAEFMLKLEDLIQRAPLDWTADRLFEPRTGLEFYPVPKDGLKWPEFAATQPRYSRDPCKFLLEQYERYIECGLLYSGHIRHSDRKLYDAVRFYGINSGQFESADAFFAAHDILIAADLANPVPEKSQRVKTILDINTALAGRKAVLGHAATHGKRSHARRAKRQPDVSFGPR